MSEAPETGSLVDSNLHEIAAVSCQDPRNAAARAIRGFLESQVFVLSGINKVADKPFKLSNVSMEWPDSHEGVVYPSATIVERPGEFQGHNLAPTILEETYNQFGEGTVLWKTSELVVDFQVDYWTNDNPTREAIAALLPVIFSPFEDQSSIRVYSPPAYFSRPVRLLLKDAQRVDNSEDGFSRIKRLSTTVTATIEAVHLRNVTQVIPSQSFEAGETVEVT